MHIRALPAAISWRASRLSPGSRASAAESAALMRVRNSPAAARVKVTISISEISAGDSLSVSSRIILSVSVAVLPEPAAADTSRVLPLVSIAVRCEFVNSTAMLKYLVCFVARLRAARQALMRARQTAP